MVDWARQASMFQGPPPWHMWGSSTNFQLNDGTRETNELQVVNIQYNRPECWRFFFEANVNATTIAGGNFVEVYFDLRLGVGRSQTIIRNFERFRFDLDPTDRVHQTFSNSVIAPRRDPSLDPLPSLLENIVTQIPGQDIQVVARAILGSFGAGDVVEVSASAFLSPISHQRPDWFQGEFVGGELNGR